MGPDGRLTGSLHQLMPTPVPSGQRQKSPHSEQQKSWLPEEEAESLESCKVKPVGDDELPSAALTVQLNDFVGEHGAYQLAITALLFIRYVLLGLMANSGPLMTPDVTFYCHLPMEEVLLIMPNISTLAAREQELEIKEEFKQICQIDLHLYQNHTQLANLTHTKSQAKTTPLIVAAGQQRQAQVTRSIQHQNNRSALVEATHLQQLVPQGQGQTTFAITTNIQKQQEQASSSEGAAASTMARIRECTDFTYELALDQGLTMTNEFDLVCDREWLRSLFQSLLSASIVVAHVFWGTFSDKYGRFQAQRICLVVSLFAGLFSIFAFDFWTFTLTRALCSFGDLGMVVSLTTTVVELVGSRYRGLSVALVNFGYALGVSLLPYVVAYFENFRVVIAFTVLCHVLTMPLVLATNESVRWLLTNRKFEKARRELKRISRWNRSWQAFWDPIGQRPITSGQFRTTTNNQEADGRRPAAATINPTRLSVRQRDSNLSRQQREQREAFELLFTEFIAQIEAQNMCDPSAVGAPNKQVVGNSPSTSTSRLPPDTPTISVEQQRDSDNSQQALANGHAKGPDLRHSSVPDNCRARPATLDGLQSASCNYIDRLEPLESDALHERPLATIESRRQQLLDAKLKTLTLPTLSRDSSLCANEAESIETHLRQRESLQQGLVSDREGCGKQNQPDCINLVAHQLSFMGRVNRLFRDKKLMICVFTIVWTTFNSELLYTSFIIINLEVGEDVYLNYILGGCMEALAAIMASLLLSYSPRRVSLIAFWLLISFSCFGLSLAHIDSHWAVWMLALAKFSQSSLSSIASVAAYESFPTFLRQSGSGLVFTLGMLGSVFAPLIFAEFDDHAGMDRVLMTFSFSSLTAAILIYLYLDETRDCELQ